jgi:hypothetical protein
LLFQYEPTDSYKKHIEKKINKKLFKQKKLWNWKTDQEKTLFSASILSKQNVCSYDFNWSIIPGTCHFNS